MEKCKDPDDGEGFCSSRDDDQQEFPNACREAGATCSAGDGNSDCKDPFKEGVLNALGDWGLKCFMDAGDRNRLYRSH